MTLQARKSTPPWALTHARILLKADEAEEGPGWQDEQIAEALETSIPTVERTRKRFLQGGLDVAESFLGCSRWHASTSGMGKKREPEAVYLEWLEVEYRNVRYGVHAHLHAPQNTYSIERIRDLRGLEWFEPAILEREGRVMMHEKPLRTKGQVRATALKYIEAWFSRPRAR